MPIITDNKVRQFLYGYQVPEKVRKDYDWLNDGEKLDGWIKYRGRYCYKSDFIYSTSWGPEWNGYVGETYFSGILINIIDSESYKIGRWYQ